MRNTGSSNGQPPRSRAACSALTPTPDDAEESGAACEFAAARMRSTRGRAASSASIREQCIAFVFRRRERARTTPCAAHRRGRRHPRTRLSAACRGVQTVNACKTRHGNAVTGQMSLIKRTETSNFGREAQKLLWATHLHVRGCAARTARQAAGSEPTSLASGTALQYNCTAYGLLLLGQAEPSPAPFGERTGLRLPPSSTMWSAAAWMTPWYAMSGSVCAATAQQCCSASP